MFQLVLNHVIKNGQEKDWKVSWTTCVVPTQEEEMNTTTSRPLSTFRIVLAHDWHCPCSPLASLASVSA